MSAFDHASPATNLVGREEYNPLMAGEAGPSRVTRVPSSPPFLLKVHPARWQVLGGRVLPNPGKHKLQAGLSAVESDPRTGRLRAGTSLAEAKERGWQILPQGDLPPGLGVGSYLYRPDGREDVVLLIWERCFPGSTTIRCDEAGWVQYLSWLVDSGKVPPPPLYVLEGMRDAAQERLARAQDRVRTQPSAIVDVDRETAIIEVIEAELEARGATEPVPAQPGALDDVDLG
jgi:hypothetical protein